jgi:hypothetical protein
MQMPFTVEQFFEVFQRYNVAVWPAQVVAVVDAFIAVGAALRGARRANRLAAVVLAALWLWMGAVYHLQFFRQINPAATIFGVAFLIQAAMFIWFGVVRDRLTFDPRLDPAGVLGSALMLYALAVYPMLGSAFGHSYPASPTFGLPCPTTIFTLGLMLWLRPRLPVALLAVPMTWAVIGTIAAVQLGVAEDFGLAASALLSLPLLLRHERQLEPRPA